MWQGCGGVLGCGGVEGVQVPRTGTISWLETRDEQESEHVTRTKWGDLGAMPGSTFVWGNDGSLPDAMLMALNRTVQKLVADDLHYDIFVNQISLSLPLTLVPPA